MLNKFKNYLYNKFGYLFMVVFMLTAIMSLVSIIIYGLDIPINLDTGNRVTPLSHITNSKRTVHFFKINETHAFGVFKDDDNVRVSNYTRNYFPFCLICGWNQQAFYKTSKSLNTPKMVGNLIYSTDTTSYEKNGIPTGVYTYLNIETNDYGFVSNPNELITDWQNDKYAIKVEDVLANYPKLSMSTHEDEDCQIAMAVLATLYVVLFIWGIIALFTNKK